VMSPELRAAAVAEAHTWLRTPYHHMGDGEQRPGRQLKGVGIDCAQILIETYAAVGALEWFSTGKYGRDWMMHNGEERYLSFILQYTEEYDWHEEPIQPADIVVWRFGKSFSHGGIVTEWPFVIHAYASFGFVDKSDTSMVSYLTQFGNKPRPMRAFRVR